MLDTAVYQEIAERTGGNVYIGVVGPVRTGKSTFIKRFMETMVLPELEDEYVLERTRDELPQSGSGRTVMTAEPKFIPENAVELQLPAGVRCSVRMVDSVGYMIAGAGGGMEDGSERMVMTPWYDEEIPMSRAAEEGTCRVISEHSTIGILVTTDGSVCGFAREDYVPAEQRAVQELQRIGKPFLILLNCAEPHTEAAAALAAALSEEYARPCIPVNCQQLEQSDMEEILRQVLNEFPITKYRVYLPSWMEGLDSGCELRCQLFSSLLEAAEHTAVLGDTDKMLAELADSEYVSEAVSPEQRPGTGEVSIRLVMQPQLYYRTISQESGFEIRNDRELMELLRSVCSLKQEYERVHEALESARTTGYGIVMPTPEEMHLEEPQIVRQGGRYGVRLKASAPSIHMLMANIETEVSPAIGGEKASEDVINFLLQGYDGDINRIWESNIFGKPLNDIAGEGLNSKIKSMPQEAQEKLRGTVQRIINEGSGGLICILL